MLKKVKLALIIENPNHEKTLRKYAIDMHNYGIVRSGCGMAERY